MSGYQNEKKIWSYIAWDVTNMNGDGKWGGKASEVCLDVLYGTFPEDLMEMKIKLKDVWLLQEF